MQLGYVVSLRVVWTHSYLQPYEGVLVAGEQRGTYMHMLIVHLGTARNITCGGRGVGWREKEVGSQINFRLRLPKGKGHFWLVESASLVQILAADPAIVGTEASSLSLTFMPLSPSRL